MNRSHPRVWRFIVIGSALSLTACLVVPQRHTVVDMVQINGTILQDGQPVPDVKLSVNSVSNMSACDAPIAFATTDENGRFRFDEIASRKSIRTVILAPSSPTYSLTICSVGGNETSAVFSETIWATLPVSLTLTCEADAESEIGCAVSDWVGFNYMRGHPEYRACRPGPLPASSREKDDRQTFECPTITAEP